jgi:hypothetical protein
MISLNGYIILKNELNTSGDIDKIRKRITEYSQIILSDGIQKSLDYLDDLLNHNIKTEDEVTSIRDSFMNEFEGDIIKGSSGQNYFFAPRKLFKNILNDKYFQHFASVYDNYLLFSKFDHFNSFHFKITKSDYYQIKLRIKRSITLLPFHAYLITKILIVTDEEHFNDLKKLMDLFGNLMVPAD